MGGGGGVRVVGELYARRAAGQDAKLPAEAIVPGRPWCQEALTKARMPGGHCSQLGQGGHDAKEAHGSVAAIVPVEAVLPNRPLCRVGPAVLVTATLTRASAQDPLGGESALWRGDRCWHGRRGSCTLHLNCSGWLICHVLLPGWQAFAVVRLATRPGRIVPGGSCSGHKSYVHPCGQAHNLSAHHSCIMWSIPSDAERGSLFTLGSQLWSSWSRTTRFFNCHS